MSLCPRPDASAARVVAPRRRAGALGAPLAVALAAVVAAIGLAPLARAADAPTTAKTYEWVETPALPRVSERAERGEVRFADRIVRFPINVWGGWAPIVAANGGFKANPDSLFAKRFGFQVELVVVEDPSDLLTRYVNGETPILWGTVDMLVLFASQLTAGPKPKVFQQIDWSNGGDGIVVRTARVKSANDLRGRSVALAAFTPSHYYLLTVLKAAGIAPGDVRIRYTRTPFEAARAFVDVPDVDAMVSFAPDIYAIPEHAEAGKGTRLLTSTADAKRLIADVWAIREDFAKAHPEVVDGLVAGIFEGMEIAAAKPEATAALLFEGFKDYGIPSVEDCSAMMRDAHLTNYAENKAFFTDPQNPTSFARLWNDAAALYREAGAIEKTLAAEEVMDASVLAGADLARRWKGSKVAYGGVEGVTDEARARLVERREQDAVVTMVVYFGAASERFDETSDEVRQALEEVAKLAGKFAGALILVEGFADPSASGLAALEARKGDNRQVPRIIAARKRRLIAFSEVRAAFVRRALAERYGLPAEQFHVAPQGGARPLTSVAEERWKNRRVEISVIPLEGE